MPELRVAVLGPVLAEDRTGALVPVPGTLARTFLTALVLARGRAVTTESLIDDLWADEPPRGARAALQTLVSRLRRATADGLVVSTASGYVLGVDTDATDLGAAERMLGGTPDAPVLRAALDRWRGEPGGDLEGSVAGELADRAGAVRRDLRRRLATVLQSSGDPDAAAALWRDEAAADPFDEATVAGLVRALADAGQAAEALAVFAAHRDRLSDELGADPSADLVRLNAEVLRSTGPVSGSVRRVGLRAAPNALIGREADLATVTRLLSQARLVTILGAGGLGKTRLAQAAATTVPPACGVVVVELAPLTTGEDVVPAIGALLGIAEVRSARSLRDAVVADLRSRVVRALGEEPTLLVLDNCEHILEPVAAFTADLLAELPGLRVLTTSRAPLAVAGEVVAPLAPLPVEADGAAVRLFTDRARAARPGAVLPVDAVRRICTRLDGSPLAIELAAARIRGMSVDEIERRLDDRFALLRGGDRSAPERHRTLLAVIEWSWRLLDDGARDLLTRLALFPDGLSVDAVEAVAAPSRVHDALDDLAELVEQSLVQLVEQEGEPVRYRLLETVREFGAARLEESGATGDVRAAMTRWACRVAAGHDLFIVRTTDQVVRFRGLEREADNLVTMLRWGLRAGDAVAVAPLFSALAGYWSFRGAHGEVAAIASDVVAVLRTVPPEAEAEAEHEHEHEHEPATGVRTAAVLGLVIACATAAFSDRRTSVRARAALRRLRRAGVTGVPVVDAQAELLLTLGRRAAGESALTRLRADPDTGVACLAHLLSAPLTENDGELERALGFSTRARLLAEQAGDVWTSGTAAVSVTQLAGQLGRYEQALAAAATARERLEQFGAEDDLVEVGWSVGLSAAATGDVDRARSLAAELAALPASPRCRTGRWPGWRPRRRAGTDDAARARGPGRGRTDRGGTPHARSSSTGGPGTRWCRTGARRASG
ncbi:BTAD domain-containing putative transcriptional regulator [Curtobacterium sp. MCPF17_052]|uniref:BTAD domain-containing putative transcriptional regulator n=1 Tax=Curtobacterium sp. MCPF17_052 TaxID=2175655 RepID=UPI0024E01189|nr:BTAD domain-containing putative transcriptional regulator [Curtobacterium sp. MCPF17_052]WIB13683.1 BTAD domain-containing putative transcriptional regulator [Curtobacterium sp. MCPF17_052]